MNDLTPKHKEEWKNLLIGEMLLLGVLSKSLQTFPDRAWLQSLVEEDIFSEVPLESEYPEFASGLSLLQSWSGGNQGGISDAEFDGLKDNYTRLFIGLDAVLAPPWESVYFNKDKMVFQEETLQVRSWYRRYGLVYEKLHQEPDDHIGVELSFLAYLSQLALQALEEGSRDEFESLLAAQNQFLIEHPLRWAPRWCELVEQHAKSDFYRGLALLTTGALLTIADQIALMKPQGIPE